MKKFYLLVLFLIPFTGSLLNAQVQSVLSTDDNNTISVSVLPSVTWTGLQGLTTQGNIDLRFLPIESDENPDNYCVKIQVKGNDGADYLGISSIRINYDSDVLLFSGSSSSSVTVGSYQEINLGANDGNDPDSPLPVSCTSDEGGLGFSPYYQHGFDGFVPGDILLTLVLESSSIDLPTGPIIFACPNIDEGWVDVSQICFEVLNPVGDPNLEFIGSMGDSSGDESGTNFNTSFNNPAVKYLNGTFESLNTSYYELLGITPIYGCIDSIACNYNADANVNDGSCIIPIETCPDPCNAIVGCTDDEADNFNPNANCDDGTCVFPLDLVQYVIAEDENGTISVSVLPDANWTGPEAITANAQVTLVVPTVGFELGNLVSLNGNWGVEGIYDSPIENIGFTYINIGLVNLGTIDIEYTQDEETVLFTFENIGECVLSVGLMESDDPFASPNSESANVGNSIITLGGGTNNVWVGNIGIVQSYCASIEGFVFYDENGNGFKETLEEGIPEIVLYFYNGVGSFLDSTVTDTNGFYAFENLESGNYNVLVAQNPANQIATTPTSELEFLYANENHTTNFGYNENGPTIEGCTDPTACNYNPSATVDNGTCTYIPFGTCDCLGTLPNPCGDCSGNGVLGCTDPVACNYNPDAACDDGSCYFANCLVDIELITGFNPETIQTNQEVVFAINVSNEGPNTATNVSILGLVPSGLDFINHSTSAGYYNPASGLWTINAMIPGQTEILTIVASPSVIGTYTNMVEVVSCDQTDIDSSPNNNDINEDDQAQAVITVEEAEQKTVEYVISTDDNGLVSVSVLPATTWTGAFGITISARVTVLVPTGDFEPGNIVSTNGDWLMSSHIIAPAENPDFDYVTFELNTNYPLTYIEYIKDVNTLLFTFENIGECVPTLELMEMNDPFSPPNSQNTIIGNHIEILGGDINTNLWAGNIGMAEFDCPPEIVLGCTDSTATNYNPDATEDDGSCIFDNILGCTDSTATNYNPDATEDDGSCIFDNVLGCTDSTATNYNPDATEDDGSCVFVGVNHLENEQSFLHFYPNPSNDFLNIDIRQELVEGISIFDLNGKLVVELTEITNQSIQINVKNWQAGVYIVKAIDHDRIQWDRILVN